MELKYQLPSDPSVYVDLLDDEDVRLMFDEVGSPALWVATLGCCPDEEVAAALCGRALSMGVQHTGLQQLVEGAKGSLKLRSCKVLWPGSWVQGCLFRNTQLCSACRPHCMERKPNVEHHLKVRLGCALRSGRTLRQSTRGRPTSCMCTWPGPRKTSRGSERTTAFQTCLLVNSAPASLAVCLSCFAHAVRKFPDAGLLYWL